MTQIPKTEAEVASIVREIDEKGFSIMEGAIPAAFLDEILAEIDRLQSVRPGGGYSTGAFHWFCYSSLVRPVKRRRGLATGCNPSMGTPGVATHPG